VGIQRPTNEKAKEKIIYEEKAYLRVD